MSKPIRVVLVDDHDQVRRGIRALLESQGVVVIGEASDGAGAVRLAAELQPDIILMDIHMPGIDGIEATRLIVASGSRVRVLALSASDLSCAYQMLHAGATEFVSKDRAFEDLVPTLKKLVANE